MSKVERKSLTVRVTPEEDAEITKRAQASNMTKSEYMVHAALSGRIYNERALSFFMENLCDLENILETSPDMSTMRNQVETWRTSMIAKMGKAILWQ